MHIKFLMATTLALWTSAAFAQETASSSAPPGTEAGAKALASDLAAYVSQGALDKGVVKVTPDPVGYRIAVDLKPLLGAIEGAAGSIQIAPYSVVVNPVSDGTWAVEGGDAIAVALDVTVGGRHQTTKYDVGPGRFQGIFSPELGTFLSTTARYEGGKVESSEAGTEVKASFGPMTYEMLAHKAGTGVVDFTGTQGIADFSETVTAALDPATPDQKVPIRFSVTGIDATSKGTGLKSRTLMDLWAFAVAHADETKLAAEQTRLKTLLTDALPLWDTIEGGYGANGLKVDTPYGTFNARKLSQSFGGDGIKSSGNYSYSLGFEGLEVASPLVPAWAKSLIPHDFLLTAKATGIDLDSPARILIDDLDVTRSDKPFSDEAEQKVLDGFKAHPPRIVIEPSHLKSPDLDVEMKGSFTFEGAQPEVTFSVEIAGLDTAIKKLQDAGAADQTALQAAGGLSMAKGFGKALPDGRTEWVIVSAADGSVSINGVQMSGPTGSENVDKEAPTDDNALPDDDSVTPDEGMVPNDEPAPDALQP